MTCRLDVSQQTTDYLITSAAEGKLINLPAAQAYVEPKSLRVECADSANGAGPERKKCFLS